jgi:hypothetical protein
VSKKVTLSDLITAGDQLTEKQKDSLYEVLSYRARQESRIDLRRVIDQVELEDWDNYSIYQGLIVEGDTFTYCANQHYSVEIAYMRRLITGKA